MEGGGRGVEELRASLLMDMKWWRWVCNMVVYHKACFVHLVWLGLWVRVVRECGGKGGGNELGATEQWLLLHVSSFYVTGGSGGQEE